MTGAGNRKPKGEPIPDPTPSGQEGAIRASTRKAFLSDADAPAGEGRHIVDTLIRERCPSFADHWTWPAVRRVLYPALGYDLARDVADTLLSMPNGRASFEYLSGLLDIDSTVSHLDRLPAEGRVVLAVNHPTGLADGVAIWDAASRIRQDIVFFANADAIRVNPAFDDIMIPVEWVLEKRSPAKTRETLKRAAEAFEKEQCIVIFPSGKLAQMKKGKLTEQSWFTTVIALARKRNAPIVPVNVTARNSRMYYLLSKLSGELRDITLFHELLNKRRARFDITVGKAIDPQGLSGDMTELTTQLRDFVSYRLAREPDAEFSPE